MKSDNLPEIVKTAVKSREELQGVVCKYMDSRDFASNPVCAFTLCIGMGKTRFTNSSDGLDVTSEKEIKLCLLAPSGAGGKRLYEVACWISEAVKEVLTVSSVEIGEVKFQNTNSTLYLDIVIKVEETEKADASQDNGREFEIVVSGMVLEGVVSIEVNSDVVEKRGQLLNGYRLAEKSMVEYRIALKMEVPLFRYGSSFTLEIRNPDKRDIYSECIAVNSKKTYLSSGEVSYCYDIISYDFEEKHRGVDDVG